MIFLDFLGSSTQIEGGQNTVLTMPSSMRFMCLLIIKITKFGMRHNLKK